MENPKKVKKHSRQNGEPHGFIRTMTAELTSCEAELIDLAAAKQTTQITVWNFEICGHLIDVFLS